MIEEGVWSDEGETEFRADCVLRSVDTHRGWRRYCNFPDGGNNEWLNDDLDQEELFDPHMPYQEVVTILL